MKKRKLMIAATLIALAMLIPVRRDMDDGGSKEYSAALYRVVLRHSLAQRDGPRGYLSGTEISLFGMEIYNDVMFVPSVGE